MCIARSVGSSGANDITDVMVFQSLFNLNLARFRSPRPAPLKVDGRIGAKTIAAIETFETRVMGLGASDGMLAPGDATVTALLKGLPPGPVKEKLAIVMPRAVPASINRYYDALVASMTRHAITTPLRIAHFIAQIGHESASFRYTEELADGSAYEGRRDLGNTEPGDGRRYKGRGLIQLTGRANYAAYSEATGIDYLASPQTVAKDPFVATDVSCWFWSRNKLNSLADRDDIKAVTRRVNGGYNGLDDRMDYLGRAKAVLAARP